MPDRSTDARATIAIVVTYRRQDQLLLTLRAVARQTAAIDHVIVVDNANDAALADVLALAHPDAIYVPSAHNVGPGGGFALGIRRAQAFVADWYWLLDDDSPPAPEALASALEAAAAAPRPLGAVGLRGGHVRRGRIRHDLPLGAVTQPQPAGFLLTDGSIVAAEAVRRVGVPREDFFIMMEDLEFSIRLHEAGLGLVVRPADGSQNLYLGSGAPWRGYYQSRNHLRMAIERRSWWWLWGWIRREMGINLHHLRHLRLRSIQFRTQGACDAVRNKMGRVVDPG